jgi:hypothetical protein
LQTGFIVSEYCVNIIAQINFKFYNSKMCTKNTAFKQITDVRFQVLMVMSMKFRVFWDVAPYSTSGTLVNLVTTRRYIPEDSKLQITDVSINIHSAFGFNSNVSISC